MKLDQLIGKGMYNEVYKTGDITVKLFNEGYAKADVMNEAYVVARIEETGLNTPTIREVLNIDGKLAITMDYVEGKTLLQLMEEDSDNVEKYVDQLVDIQIDMHKMRCPNLPKLKDKLMDRIERSGLDSTKKYELMTILDGAPKHKKVCHGDFTPENIIIPKDGKPVIIDWNHATQGNASADVARTYLWLCLYNEGIADMYLDKFCDKSKTAKRYVQQWLPVVAAARIYKNVPGEQELLQKWVDIFQYE